MTKFLCLFHDAARAHSAARALQDLGFTPGAINTVGKEGGAANSLSLSHLGVPDRDLRHLQDGLQDGGVLLALEAPEDRSSEIERVFHRFSADKIDEAAVSLEAEAVPAAVAPLKQEIPVAAAYDSGVAPVGDAILPIAQEELLVGKRAVDRGGVRVYRRTVEEPVAEAVTLHDERVVLEQRKVNRPATEADLRAGTQQFELIETAEVPVVEKVARVVEEVRVGTAETERTEVVQDSVRHTEVEVLPIEPAKTHI